MLALTRDLEGARRLGAERLWWRTGPSPKLTYAMSKVNRERRAAEAASPGNGSGEQFLERLRGYRYAKLHERWIVCPECGGRELVRPGPEIHRRIPEAAGACGVCGAAFASGPDGRLRLLVPRTTSQGVRR